MTATRIMCTSGQRVYDAFEPVQDFRLGNDRSRLVRRLYAEHRSSGERQQLLPRDQQNDNTNFEGVVDGTRSDRLLRVLLSYMYVKSDTMRSSSTGVC